jgi:nicotinamidase-related amidase
LKTALIVIDVQQSFTHRPYWQDLDVAAYTANQQHLIDTCAAKGIPVVQIFHVDETGGAQNPFSRASGLVKTLDGIRITPDVVFYKTVHSSLFGKNASGQTLQVWLEANGIEEVIVTGIRTEQCCETTTRHASDLGYQVRFATDATLTFPMTHASGRQYSSQEIRERTELVLAGRFAKIVSAHNAFA